MNLIEGTFCHQDVWWCRHGASVGRGRTPAEAEADCAAVARIIVERREKHVPVDLERRVASSEDLVHGLGAAQATVAALRRQSRRASLIEAATSTAIGFVLSYIAQLAIFPLYGIHVSHGTNLQLIGWFTIISVVRGYWVRRMWDSEWWKRTKKEAL
jgi:hypothetical protein